MRILAAFITALISLAALAAVPFNGRIIDFNGRPIKGARIHVKNPRIYTRSDKQGRFGLTDVQPDDTLHVKIGKTTHIIPVEGAKGMSIVVEDDKRIIPQEDLELVDMGMGYVRRREYLAPISVVTGEQLAATGETFLLPAMRGSVPGVNFVAKKNDDGTYSYNINIRNATSFVASTAPLWVVDGSIGSIPPSQITVMEVESVEVLKDGAGYGTRGANGVIIVKLKNGLR